MLNNKRTCKEDAARASLSPDDRKACDLLRYVLNSIEHPQKNAKDYYFQAGAAWWRMQNFMAWLAPHVIAAGDQHCMEIHGHAQELGE